LATTIAQRLVRRICPKCARKRDFTPQELEIFKTFAKRYDVEFDLEGKTTFEPVGCEHCNNTGFYGRIAANEMLSINDDIKDLIIQDGTITDIRKAAFESGYRPLVCDALQKVLQGHTTVNEVKRKIGL
jgi:type IV pilus assembly protein PilB